MDILNHRKYGTGQSVVYILHGIFGMLDNWHHVAGKLGEIFTVVTSDARNHGKSFHSGEMNFDLMAEDVLNLMKHLGHKRIILMGHSMGGKTAMQFAAKYPENLEKLLVVDIANRAYLPSHLSYFEAFESIDFTKISSRTEADAALEKYATELTVRQFLLKNLEPLPQGGYRPKFNIQALKNHYAEIIGTLKLLPMAFSGPSVFISGEKSNYLMESDHQELRAYFPNADFVKIKNAGHWVHADNPLEFIDTVQTFIQN